MSNIIQAQYCLFGMYQIVNGTRIHYGNLEIFISNTWRFTANPKQFSPLGQNREGSIRFNGSEDEFYDIFQGYFGKMSGFSLLGFDRTELFPLVTPFDTYICVPAKFGANMKNVAYNITGNIPVT